MIGLKKGLADLRDGGVEAGVGVLPDDVSRNLGTHEDYAAYAADNGPTAPPILSVQGLRFSFPGSQPLFQDLNFAIREGEFVSLLAPSGLGKTTLFRLIAGLLHPDQGAIDVREPQSEGEALPLSPGFTSSRPEPGSAKQRSGKGRHKSLVGYMPQNDCLMPWRNVLDNAALGLEMSGMPRSEARKSVLELLSAFGLAGMEHAMPHELSGGMRQRVSFMRCMLGGGSLLLLDEPFGALDAMTRVAMQEWLLDIWEKRRRTVLFITHDIDEALLLSDRLLVAPSRPVSVLHELNVGRPRPRRYADLLRPEYIAIKEKALALLSSQPGLASYARKEQEGKPL